MGLTAAEYLNQLQALLPSGAAWPRDPSADMTRLLDALAAEFARIDARGETLLDESDPRTVTELRAEWQAEFGLPEFFSATAATLQQARAELHGKVTAIGGNDKPYLVRLAASLGYQITITEYRPFRVGRTPIGRPISSKVEWLFTWKVASPGLKMWALRAGGPIGEPLRVWGNGLLEYYLNKYKPSHTHLFFEYGG